MIDEYNQSRDKDNEPTAKLFVTKAGRDNNAYLIGISNKNDDDISDNESVTEQLDNESVVFAMENDGKDKDNPDTWRYEGYNWIKNKYSKWIPPKPNIATINKMLDPPTSNLQSDSGVNRIVTDRID